MIKNCLFDINNKVKNIQVLGYCKNLNKAEEDYIVKYDEFSAGEYLIGSFRNGNNFGIYLPFSKNDTMGNISLSKVEEISFENEIENIPINKVEEL